MQILEGAAARKAVAALANREPVPNAKIEKTVAKIVGDVRNNGDRALRKYAEKFDGLAKGEAVQVTRAELQQAVRSGLKQRRRTFAHSPSGRCRRRGCERSLLGFAWGRRSSRSIPSGATRRADDIHFPLRC